jgi:flavin-dependent dehydrogenase
VDCYNLYVWRDKFDHFLATSSGADLRDQTRLLRVWDRGDKVEAVLKRNGREFQVRSRYLIGADGGHSRVVRNIAPEIYRDMTWAVACQKYYEGTVEADERYLYWFLKPNMGPFPWLNLKDGQVIVGLAMIHGQEFGPKFFLHLDFLKREFGLKIKREVATEACIANTMTPLNRFLPGRGRVLLAGDAMGLMHQGGEGISCALASGGHAAQALADALAQGTDALALYRARVRPEMETALDQFNPLRMRATTASDTSRQPGLLHALSPRQKALAIRDTVVFLGSEFRVAGMGAAVVRNTLQRLFLGRYRIPAAE